MLQARVIEVATGGKGLHLTLPTNIAGDEKMERAIKLIDENLEPEDLLIVDCSRVHILNTDSLEGLLAVQRHCATKGINMLLCGVDSVMRTLLYGCSLHTQFVTVGTFDDAQQWTP